jgi:hypothetical protein
MKTAIKRENDEFLVISLKHSRVPMRHANPLGTQKLWAIIMKMTIKHEINDFLVITLKHVSRLKVVVNRPITIKLWEIAHENGHKTRKRRVSGHISQTCKGSNEACKSAWNPKTMSNKSLK